MTSEDRALTCPTLSANPAFACKDSNAPTWTNMLDGQINLRDAVRETISLEAAAGGKSYKLNEKHAVLLVRCAFPLGPSTFRPTFRPTFRLPLSRLTPSLFVLAVGRQPPWLAPL
jgi:hypothetical protein